MKTGTKTILFGTHQFIIHPVFVFIAWIKCLRRLPSLKELMCIVIHDLGYWGKPNVDGTEGEDHPKFAAKVMLRFGMTEQSRLCLYHSRFFAKKGNAEPSILCWVDKYASRIYPDWLWVFLSWASGELKEYMSNPKYEIHHAGETDAFEHKRKYNKIVDEEWMPKYFGGKRDAKGTS